MRTVIEFLAVVFVAFFVPMAFCEAVYRGIFIGGQGACGHNAGILIILLFVAGVITVGVRFLNRHRPPVNPQADEGSEKPPP